MGIVPEMIKRLERSSLEKSKRTARGGDFIGDSGKSHFLPSRKLRVKPQIVFPLPRDCLKSCMGWLACRNPGDMQEGCKG